MLINVMIFWQMFVFHIAPSPPHAYPQRTINESTYKIYMFRNKFNWALCECMRAMLECEIKITVRKNKWPNEQLHNFRNFVIIPIQRAVFFLFVVVVLWQTEFDHRLFCSAGFELLSQPPCWMRSRCSQFNHDW